MTATRAPSDRTTPACHGWYGYSVELELSEGLADAAADGAFP